MGLDVTHGCWHGAYSAFSRWRQTIAEAAGYDVWRVEYDEPAGYIAPTIMLDWGHIPEATLYGEWDSNPSDPLIILFAHSDCEGVIYPPQAALLAKRLEEILPLLPTEDDQGHIGNWRNKTQQFIDGLNKAASREEVVEFG
jgi:hypothetical protein